MWGLIWNISPRGVILAGLVSVSTELVVLFPLLPLPPLLPGELADTTRLPSMLPQYLLLLWLVMKRISRPNWTNWSHVNLSTENWELYSYLNIVLLTLPLRLLWQQQGVKIKEKSCNNNNTLRHNLGFSRPGSQRMERDLCGEYLYFLLLCGVVCLVLCIISSYFRQLCPPTSFTPIRLRFCVCNCRFVHYPPIMWYYCGYILPPSHI